MTDFDDSAPWYFENGVKEAGPLEHEEYGGGDVMVTEGRIFFTNSPEFIRHLGIITIIMYNFIIWVKLTHF